MFAPADRERLLAGITLTAALAALAPASADAADDDRDGAAQAARAVEGTWVVTIVPPVAAAPSHKGFISFVRGGVVLAGPEYFFPPFVGSIVRMANQQGSWEWTGRQQFAWTFSGLGYDASGAPVGFLKFSGRARLTDHDTFEGAAKIAVCDINLNCGAYSAQPAGNFGTRFKVEAIEP